VTKYLYELSPILAAEQKRDVGPLCRCLRDQNRQAMPEREFTANAVEGNGPIPTVLGGDTAELCRRLRNPQIRAMAERNLVAAKLEERVKRPRGQPSSIETRLTARDIARYVHDLIADGDYKKTAIDAASDVFGCKRATVYAAIKANPDPYD